MIYVLLGKSSSGKTTIAKEWIKQGYGKQIITTTTRPKRKNEKDGVDYFFTTEHLFDIMKQEDKLISIFEAENGWKYGINENDINDRENQIVVLEPSGYKQLVDYIGKEQINSIYIDSLYTTRMVRAIKRGDNFEENLRRAESDERDFEGIEDKVDLIVRNDFDYDHSLINILEQIKVYFD